MSEMGNTKKTKSMPVTKKQGVVWICNEVEVVQSFDYLGIDKMRRVHVTRR